MDLAAGRDHFLAVGAQIVDIDIEDHVAGPRSVAVGLEDAAVDAALAAGLDVAVVHIRHVLDFPAEDFGVEIRYFRRILRHQLPMDYGTAHNDLLAWVVYPKVV